MWDGSVAPCSALGHCTQSSGLPANALCVSVTAFRSLYEYGLRMQWTQWQHCTKLPLQLVRGDLHRMCRLPATVPHIRHHPTSVCQQSNAASVWLLAIGSAFANDIFGRLRGGCPSSQGIASGSTETLNARPLGALPADPTSAAAATSISFVRCCCNPVDLLT